MRIIDGFENLPPFAKNTIVALGNFDGIHLGHKKILEFVVHRASHFDLLSIVLTFSPHPENILGKRKVQMIQTLEQRLGEIEKFGIQTVLIVPFDRKFSSLTPLEFFQRIIVHLLKAKVIVVGENFRFGKRRQGDVSILRRIASRYNIQVFSLPPVTKDGTKVSSSLIRRFLIRGRIEEANKFLGRPYTIDGEVIKGKSRGKIIGFPTANVRTKNEITPPGVFITRVSLGSVDHPSLTNIGHCPTFEQQEMNVESYILDFNQNLYGKNIRIHFLKKIRDEMKFPTPKDLTCRIQRDIESARAYFHLE